jgi:hypothetical protein
LKTKGSAVIIAYLLKSRKGQRRAFQSTLHTVKRKAARKELSSLRAVG